MKQRSPTIEGFRLMFSRPSLGLAEIAWRWTFGSAAILSLTFLILEYLRTLPVSPGDLFLLSTRHPVLVSQAVAHIFQSSAGRLAKSVFLLFILLSAAWVVLASLARTATVTALLNYFREDQGGAADQIVVPVGANARHRSPFGLNLFRVLATAAAFLACFGTLVLAQAASPPTNPSPGTAMLVFLMLVMGTILAWWLLNWILSLAAIFAVADGSGTFGAISKAMDLWRVRWGSIVAAGAWFGIAHMVVFFIATSVVAFPLAFVGVLPAGVVLGGVLLITLLYFAAADFLYAGKMAAYVAIAKLPEESQFVSRVSDPIIPRQSGTDRGELILCDVPPLA
jgi:hypothetical protein